MLLSRCLKQLSMITMVVPIVRPALFSTGHYMLASELRYSGRHEWIKVDGDVGTVGMSEYATKQLGDIVYIELPQPETKVAKDAEVGVVESAKAATELYSPVSGTVKETNSKVEEKPSILNKSPAKDAWLFRVKLSNPDELPNLMTETEYHDFIDSDNC